MEKSTEFITPQALCLENICWPLDLLGPQRAEPTSLARIQAQTKQIRQGWYAWTETGGIPPICDVCYSEHDIKKIDGLFLCNKHRDGDAVSEAAKRKGK